MRSEPAARRRFRCLMTGRSWATLDKLVGAAGAAARAEYEQAYTRCRKVEPVLGNAPQCPACGCPVGLLEWLPPYRVELETEGSVYADLLWTGDRHFLVSERLQRLCTDSGLTGLEMLPDGEVELVSVRHYGSAVPGACPRYFRAAAVHGGAVTDAEASGLHWVNGPPTCVECQSAQPLRWQRLVVAPSTWSGEDVFLLRDAAEMVVTDRFADWVSCNGIRNAASVPAEELGYEKYPSWD